MMKPNQFPKKFLSLRDKNGSHRRSKSQEKDKEKDRDHKSRPSSDAFWNFFKSDAAKQAAKEEEEREKEAAKVEDIVRRLAEKQIDNITTDHIRYTLGTKFAAGSVEKAVEFIGLQQQSAAGEILPYDPNVEMVGAENRGNVTCYLDALLFAMFSKLDAFECMLKSQDLPDEPKRKLVTLLRLWVNMLRSGRLIYTDMTQLIQEALAECGWREARLLEQQDTSEAFAFITETLQLPLLQLQVDLFHHGKHDTDDHKVVYERLLNLAVPEDPDGKGIKLEDCLEEYFNTKVDVLRDSHDEKKASFSAEQARRTIRVVTEEGEGPTVEPDILASPLPITPVEWRETMSAGGADNQPATNGSSTDAHDEKSAPAESSSAVRPPPRHRSTSVIQRIVLDEKGRPHTSAENQTLLQQMTRKGSTIAKAITIPAWQFFRLIPWHSTTNNVEGPRTDAEVVREFNQRPVVSICLKRYMMSPSGVPKRHNTYIDIPDSLALPQFMMPDDTKIEEDPSGFSREYKLVLQSVVCHRGDSLQSGHYIAFARVAPKLLTDNRRFDFDPPPDYEEAQWVKFDDLYLERRVQYVDDIKQALKTEMPYLLFYQIVPMVDVACAPSTTTDTETEPPSYNASKIDITTGPPTPNLEDKNQLGIMPPPADYFESSSASQSAKPPSIRLSSELDRPARISISGDEEPDKGESRRGSVTFTDSTFASPAVTPDASSPAVTPGEGTTATQRFSRTRDKLAKTATGSSRSRPNSQAGEGRISITMTRLSGLMRTSKDPLRESGVVPTNGSTSGPLTATSSATMSEPDQVKSTDAAPLVDGDETKHKHHHHHHKGKSRTKTEKGKKTTASGEPPERECSVM